MRGTSSRPASIGAMYLLELPYFGFDLYTDSFPVPDDPFTAHFGASSRHLTDTARRNVEESQWKSSSRSCGTLGSAVLQVPECTNEHSVKVKVTVRRGVDSFSIT